MDKLWRVYIPALISFSLVLLLSQMAFAAEPVRLTIAADSGSGIEQDIVDYL